MVACTSALIYKLTKKQLLIVAKTYIIESNLENQKPKWTSPCHQQGKSTMQHLEDLENHPGRDQLKNGTEELS